MRKFVYDMATAVIDYGVSMNPRTQMQFLGFDVVYCSREDKWRYLFSTSNSVGGLPEYVYEVDSAATIRKAA